MNVNMYLTAMLGIKMATVKKKIIQTQLFLYMLFLIMVFKKFNKQTSVARLFSCSFFFLNSDFGPLGTELLSHQF